MSGRQRIGPVTRAQAEVAFAAWEAAQTALTNLTPIKVLDQILTPYEVSLLARTRRPETQLINLKALRQALGRMPIESIDRQTLDDYARRRGLKPQSLRRAVAVLNAAFQFNFDDGKLPLAEMRKFKLPPNGAVRTWFLDREQEEEFYARAMGDSIGKPRLTTITKLVGLALDTGTRLDMMCRLTWDRIDLKTSTIDFRIPGEPMPKNKKRVKIAIRKRLRPLIERAHRERGANEVFFLDHRKADLLFVKWLKAQKDWARTHFAKAHVHGFRHTFITLLSRHSSLSLGEIASLVGDTEHTISKHYSHHRESHTITDF
jgi:integrase